MSVSVSGRLPDGDGNGLSAIVSELVRDPKKLHVCICILDGKKVTIDADSGETVPTARIRRIEVILDEEDMQLAENLMRRSLDRRTGREALPYDLEQEIRGAFPAGADDLGDEDGPVQGGNAS
jgi:hypothetical protein